MGHPIRFLNFDETSHFSSHFVGIGLVGYGVVKGIGRYPVQIPQGAPLGLGTNLVTRLPEILRSKLDISSD